MAYNPNFAGGNNAYYTPESSLLRPVNPPSASLPPLASSGPGPDRYAPRRGGARNRGGFDRAGSRDTESRHDRGGAMGNDRSFSNPMSQQGRFPGSQPNMNDQSGSGFQAFPRYESSNQYPSSGNGYGRATSPSASSHSRQDDRSGATPYANHTERRDPVAHKKLIGERIQRERPCRTLFVRNVSYDADSTEVLGSFRAFGDIKSHFDLVKNRGMLFITYYDSRAAERAKEAMHATTVMNRPIDLHYSLPRAEETSGVCDAEKNQGTLMLSLANEREANPVEIRRAFARFGDIKELRPGKERGTAMIEFYDSRAAISAWEAMRDTPFEGSILYIKLMWDDIHDPKSGGDGGGSGGPERSDRRQGGAPPHRGRSPDRGYARPAPYPERRPAGPPKPAEDTTHRLNDAKKIQDLLASLGNIGPGGAQAGASRPAPPPPPPQNYRPPTSYPAPAINPNNNPGINGPNARMSNNPNPQSGSYPSSYNSNPSYAAPPPPPPQRYNPPGSNYPSNSYQPAPSVPAPPPSAAPVAPGFDVMAALRTINVNNPSATTQAPPSYNPPPPQPAYNPAMSPPVASAAPAPLAPSGGGDTTQAMASLLAMIQQQDRKSVV